MNDLTAKDIAPHCKTCHQQYDLYYRIPRIVPRCGHTFCQKCIILKLMVKSNRKVFVCPQCKEEAVIRKSVADDVPKNEEIISMVKQLKRLTYNEWEEEDKKQKTECFQHGRPLQLVCQTCNYEPICSHCALFGHHRNHSFVKQRPVSKIDLSQLRTNFEIVSSSVQHYLLPQGQNNIKQRMRRKINEGLRKEVTSVFKQYYAILEKKQYELVQECDSIVINEGGIDKNIDSVLASFDILRLKYENQYQKYTNSSFKDAFTKDLSLDGVQQFMAKCNELHATLQNIEKHANQHITKITKNIGIHISQAAMFKIQQMPFSIKKVIEQMNRPLDANQVIGSPNKPRSKMNSTHSNFKNKSVIIAQPEIDKNSTMRQNRSHHKQSAVTVCKKRGTYSTIDKNELVDDVSDQGTLSELAHYKEQAHKDLKSLVDKKIQHKSIQRNTLPPKVRQPQPHTISMRPPKDESNKVREKKSTDKVVQPPRTTSVINKQSTSVILGQQNGGLMEQLKFVAPTKQISFQFLSKFQELMGEVDRQGESNTLQLNSKEINDVLLVYVLDYLRRKKYAFQVIKLVKNAITDEGMRILLGYLQNDTRTQVLNLTSNQLTTRCLDLVVLFASKNNILRTLYLSNNNKISNFQLKSRQGELDKYQFNLIL